MRIVVQEAPFGAGEEAERLAAGRVDMGAVVTFCGLVRDTPDADLRYMEIEHYPGMTMRAIESIAAEAAARWSLGDVLVIHRHGRLAPGEAIMMVGTVAPHRADAFAAADFLMDYLKSRAPFWKKEVTARGAAWVEAAEADEDALTRW